MTLQELNGYAALVRELDRAEELYAALMSAAGPGTQRITGMPGVPGRRDRLGGLAAEIGDVSEEIGQLRREIASRRSAVEAFVRSVPDVQIRTILGLRFLDGRTWASVAEAVGGGNTRYSVSASCYRYLRKVVAM